jgi:hypothetical protein
MMLSCTEFRDFEAARINEELQSPIQDLRVINQMIENIGNSNSNRTTISRTLFRRNASCKNTEATLVYETPSSMGSKLSLGSHRYLISAASLDRLIEQLVDERGTDFAFVDSFLLGYRHFTDGITVFQKIFSRMYCIPPPGAGKEECDYATKWRPFIRLRLIHIVQLWIERYYLDFHHCRKLREQVDVFCHVLETFEFDAFENQIAKADQSAYFQRLAKLFRKYMVHKERHYAAPIASPKVESRAPHLDFLSLDPKLIAYQLTISEFKRFVSVRPLELLLNLWGSLGERKMQEELIPLSEMISSFNQVNAIFCCVNAA